MVTPKDRELVISRIFDAPPGLVFKMWTDPVHMKEWLAPRGFTVPYSEGEVRPGSAWRSCMRTPDGTELWLSGVYREVVPDRKISFTHAWEETGKRGHETIVTITLSRWARRPSSRCTRGRSIAWVPAMGTAGAGASAWTSSPKSW